MSKHELLYFVSCAQGWINLHLDDAGAAARSLHVGYGQHEAGVERPSSRPIVAVAMRRQMERNADTAAA